jgi:hypothetical protein
VRRDGDLMEQTVQRFSTVLEQRDRMGFSKSTLANRHRDQTHARILIRTRSTGRLLLTFDVRTDGQCKRAQPSFVPPMLTVSSLHMLFYGTMVFYQTDVR